MNKKIEIKENEEVIVERAKKGDYTLKVIKGNTQKYITSKYDPLKEAKCFVEQIGNYNKETIFIIYGMALGYHIVELNKKIEKHNKILIIEPNEKIFKKSLELEDINDGFKQDNIYLFKGNDKYKLRGFYSTHINEKNYTQIVLKAFSSYDKIYCDSYKEVMITLKKYLDSIQLNINTIKIFSYEFTQNYFRNLKKINSDLRINQLKNKFEDIPAIIVSGGPSLEKNIKQLKDAQGKALIISLGRTLNTLIENDIIPDLVASIDPSKPAINVVKQHLNRKIPLVTLTVSQSDIINEYSGKKIFINQEWFYNLTNEVVGESMDILSQGGSVANTALAVADYIGCKPIVLIGQDLAYTDDKVHAESTVCEAIEDKGNKSTLIETFEVEGVHGGKVKTDTILLTFLRWFEVYIKQHTEKLVIDATEGGAKINGTEIMSLKDTIKKYCKKEFDIKLKLEQIIKEHEECKKEDVLLEKIIEVKEELYKVKKTALVGIKYNEKMLKYYEKGSNINIEKILKKLDNVDRKIKKYKKLEGVVSSLILPIIFDVYNRKEFQEGLNENNKEKGIRLASMGLAVYQAIRETSEQVKKIIDETINSISGTEEVENGKRDDEINKKY